MKKFVYFLAISFLFLSSFTLFALAADVDKELLRGKVVSIEQESKEEMETQLGEKFDFTVQVLNIKITKGSLAGRTIQVENDYVPLKVGQKVFLTYSLTSAGEEFSYPHPIRLPSLSLLIALLGGAIIIFAKWQGLRSFLTMALSVGIIIFFFLPQISQGKSPISIALVGGFFIVSISLYFVYGWTRKTHAAFFGTLTCLGLTFILSLLFINATFLTGQAGEQALQIRFFWGNLIDLKELFLAAIIIGSIGALNDVAVDQSATVFAIRKAKPDMSLKELYRESLSVGRDHVLSTINTLVLAYVSVALPLLLLIQSFQNLPIIFILNNEIFAEEIARAILASLGLIMVTPLTNLFACLLAIREKK